MPCSQLPIVYRGAFLAGGAEDKATTARAFARAFEGTGFAVIINHGVPQAPGRGLYAAMTGFFDQPLAAKAAFTPPDLCEALVFAAPHRPQMAARPYWPVQPPTLVPLVQDWMAEIIALTRHLSRLMALALIRASMALTDAT